MEQDPKDWVDAAEQFIGEVMAKLGTLKDEVRAVSV
jgi:sugar (pentulose or hexulose) kinase